MRSAVLIVVLGLVGFAVSCSNQEQAKAPQSPPQNTNTASAPPQAPQSTPASDVTSERKPKRPPARSVTRADVAKLYWLEGAWRGTGAPKPFFNKYTFIGGTTMKIAGFEDEELTKQVESARYDLKDGMFANPDGKDRFGASEISDTYLELVSLSEDTNKVVKMERLDNGNIRATLEWTSADGKSDSKSYILEPLKK